MIYFLQPEGGGPIKIGYTSRDEPWSASARLAACQTGSPLKLRLCSTMPGTQKDERRLHGRFSESRLHGEWFAPTPELVELAQATALSAEDQTAYEIAVAAAYERGKLDGAGEGYDEGLDQIGVRVLRALREFGLSNSWQREIASWSGNGRQ